MLMEPIFNLPKIQFVGGETQELCFCLKTPSGEKYITEEYVANFSLRKYGQRGASPVITKDARVMFDSIEQQSVIKIELEAANTLNLDGRYIYQITIVGENGHIEIPGQGIFEIIRNIYPDYIAQL